MTRSLLVVLVALFCGQVLAGCTGQQTATQDGEATQNASGVTAPETAAASPDPTATDTTDTAQKSEGLGTASTEDTPAVGTSGMVSSANPLATQAGLDVL